MKTYKQEVAESQGDAFSQALDAAEAQEVREEAIETEDPLEFAEEDAEFDVVMEGSEPPAEKTVEVDTATEAINRLTEALGASIPATPEKEVPKRPEIAQVDVSAVQKEFNEKLHESEDPFTVAMQATEKVFGPQLAAQARELQQLKRDALMTSEKHKVVFEKYGKEIETVVATLPESQQNHPDVYQYAVNKVTQDHIEDIIELQVEERLSKQTATTRPGATRLVGDTTGTPPAKKRRTVQATKHDEAMAAKFGMRLKDYLIGKDKI